MLGGLEGAHLSVLVVNDVPAPPATIAPQAVATTTTTAASLSAASGLVASPTMAAQASRMALVASLGYCNGDVDLEPDFATSPTGVWLGESAVRAQLGAAVMNTVLLLVAALVHAAVGAGLCPLLNVSLLDGLSRVRFPGLLSVVVFFLLQPTVSCCVTAVQELGAGGEGSVAVVVLLLWAALVGWVGLLLHSPFRCVRAVRPLSVHRLTCDYFVFGKGKWVDKRNSRFVQQFGLLFADYRNRAYWWAAVELLFSASLGVLGGVLPKTRPVCSWLSVLVTGACGVYLACLVWLRPFSAPLSNVVILVAAALQFMGAACVALYVVWSVSWGVFAGSTLSMMATFLYLAKSIFDTTTAIFHITRKRIRYALHRDMYVDRHVQSVLPLEAALARNDALEWRQAEIAATELMSRAVIDDVRLECTDERLRGKALSRRAIELSAVSFVEDVESRPASALQEPLHPFPTDGTELLSPVASMSHASPCRTSSEWNPVLMDDL